MQPGQPLHHPEDGKADDEEVDDGVDEQAEIQRRRAGMLCIGERGIVLAIQRDEQVGEIDAADRQAKQRVEHVLHQTAHHTGKGGADDDADSEIDDAAAHDERAEFVEPLRISQCCQRLISLPKANPVVHRKSAAKLRCLSVPCQPVRCLSVCPGRHYAILAEWWSGKLGILICGVQRVEPLAKPSCPRTSTFSCRRRALSGWIRFQMTSGCADSGIVCGQLN